MKKADRNRLLPAGLLRSAVALFAAICGWPMATAPRSAKRLVMIAADAVSVSFALWLAFALKYDSLLHGFNSEGWLYAGVSAASVLIFWTLGLYRAVIRYIGPRSLAAIVAGAFGSAAALYLLGQTFVPPAVPASVAAIYASLALTWVGGSRVVARWLLAPQSKGGESVAIYGAGEAGVQLARALNGHKGLAVLGFFDDKNVLQGSLIDGLPVWPSGQLASIVNSMGLDRVLIAVPAASRRRRSEIISKVEGLGVRVQTVPDLVDIASGRAHVDELREVDVADLLGRDPVAPDAELMAACIRRKVVMVTGAGGSIGAELCRQILRLQPRCLVLFELSEVALYEIDRELRALVQAGALDVELVALLGNVQHRRRVRDAMQACGVQTVYHAAAYKHVPIVEHNVLDGIHNNVIGTWNTAEAAVECGVETFVLISTDKAVNPTNVMGATKRFAEMVLQALHRRGSSTRFCMVRFGNVLDSSGSVVPLFRHQIRHGGPVTVTHPDVIRYFMTMEEASQLVLQASAMATGGDVFVLDMGKPVGILDLARRMVSLSGLTVWDDQNRDGDIEISFTGLRPGEKLYEELLIGNHVSVTEHPRILQAMEHSIDWEQMRALLVDMQSATDRVDVPAALALLLQGVREYVAEPNLFDSVWCRANTADHRNTSARVAA